MSIISAGTTVGTALVNTGDTTGNLVFKTGSGATTALTISGTDQSITVAGGLNLGTAIPIASGGTGQTTRQNAIDALAGSVTNGQYLRGNGTDVVMAALAAGDMTGTIAVANGGTGQTTLSSNHVILGNGTSGVQAVAPGSNGNILTSNGTTWTSTAPAGGGVTSLNGQTGAITNTGFNTIGSYALIIRDNTGITYNTTFSAGASIQHATININACGSQLLMYSSAGGVAAFSGTWRSMCSAQQAYTPFLAVRIS